MKLREYVTGRVLVWLIIAALAALLGFVKEASADPLPSKAQAAAQCEAGRQQAVALAPEMRGGPATASACYDMAEYGQGDYFRCTITTQQFGYEACDAVGVQANYPYDPNSANTCATQPAINNKAVRGASTFCTGGCEYKPKDNHGDQDPNALNLCMMGNEYCGAAAWLPTGNTCQAEQDPEAFDPKKDTCVTMTNGYGECVKSDGTHCKTAPSGRTLCWRPGETGPRSTSDGLLGGDRKQAPGVPTPPATISNPQQQTTTTTTINNTTYNSASYSGGGGTGTPGQGGSGTPGDSDGDGEQDNGPGSPGPRPGTLYTPSGKTMAGVWGAFKGRVLSSPLVTAGDNFFNLNVAGGACPVWTKSADEWLPAMTFDFHCQGVTAQLLDWAAWVLLAVIAFFCWRVAIE